MKSSALHSSFLTVLQLKLYDFYLLNKFNNSNKSPSENFVANQPTYIHKLRTYVHKKNLMVELERTIDESLKSIRYGVCM